MSAIEIRPATEADLPAITEIYEHAVRYGTATFELIPPDLAEMTRRFRALMDGGFPYLVATVEGHVIGYAYAGPYRPRPAYRFTVENSVYLKPAIHRRGIGLQLLQRLKNDYIYGYAAQGGDIAERAAISGALSLYLNFINLFTLLLQLLGQRD